MSVKPLGKFILAKPIEEENNKTQSGLFIHTDEDSALPKAEIVEVGDGFFGPDGTKHELYVKPGDIVVYIKGHKTDFEQDGEKFVFINHDSIIAITNKKKEGE